ncbi:MAG: glycosyltransferase family 4 protein [Gemmatimonadales bacterium]|nr:glycosyltransferase family 4 protein [Gemmatimonadales bacterium]MDQ3427743.1 glycosyltransferase family 4 protein [Gemmatimonadota bacterium]
MTLRVMQVLYQGGGAGSVTSTLHLSLGLARAGVHVRFVCPPDSEVEAAARASGLEVHPLRLAHGSRRSNAAALGALLARHPVDLVNSQSSRDREALTWLALTQALPVPFVATRRQMPLTFPLENAVMSRMAARVIAVSRPVGDALRRRGTPRSKLVVIHNGLVPDRVDPPVTPQDLERWRSLIGWESGRRTIGIIARPKDQRVVLRALERLEVPVRLVLAGVDPESALAARAARAPSRHAVVCLPFTPELRPLYELLELVLLPSRIEGLSQALLEAMALGKPVIASHAGGNPDLITDGVDGLLVPARNPAAWAGAIDVLLSQPVLARRLGDAGRRTSREGFPLEQTVARTRALYHDVLGLPAA